VRLRCLVAMALLVGCKTPVDFTRVQFTRVQEWLAPQPGEVSALPPRMPTAALPAPEGLTTISGELREIPLHWDPLLLAGVVGYVVERADQSEGPYHEVASIDGRSHTAWVDRGPGLVAAATPGGPAALGDGETFFYRVRPHTLSGALGEEASAVATGTTATVPDAPDDLRAYSHQPRNVPLSWRASGDPTVAGYVVERSPASRGPFEQTAEINDRFETVYVDQGLGDLRVFYYRITSVNRAGGLGEPSKPVRAVTKPEPLPPVGLRVIAQRLGANELGWEPNVETDLTGYELLRRRDGSDTTRLVASLDEGTTRVVDTDVGAGERVVYRLRALDSDGLESGAGPPIEVVSPAYELEAIARPEGNLLSWRDRRDEGWAQARIFSIGALGSSELGTASGTRFVHTGVEPGKRYRYRVVLEAADGQRAPESKVIQVEVPAR